MSALKNDKFTEFIRPLWTWETWFTYSKKFVFVIPNIVVTLVGIVLVFNVTLRSGENLFAAYHGVEVTDCCVLVQVELKKGC